PRLRALRTRKQLIPTREGRFVALDTQRVGRIGVGLEGRLINLPHRLRQRVIQQGGDIFGPGRWDCRRGNPVGGTPRDRATRSATTGRRLGSRRGPHCLERRLNYGERFRVLIGGPAQAGFQHATALFHFEADIRLRLPFFAQPFAIAAPPVKPCADGVDILAEAPWRDAPLPAVVAYGLQRYAFPAGFRHRTPKHFGGKLIVAVHEDLRPDGHGFAQAAFGGEGAGIDRRRHALDG